MELKNKLKSIIDKFDLNYSNSLYKYLRDTGEIQQATGIEREEIIKQAKGDLKKCKSIQIKKYLYESS